MVAASSAVTVTVISLSPTTSDTDRLVPCVSPSPSAITTLAPSSLATAVTAVDDTPLPTLAA